MTNNDFLNGAQSIADKFSERLDAINADTRLTTVGIFPATKNSKGQITAHPARFVDGVLVEYVPAAGSVVQ